MERITDHTRLADLGRDWTGRWQSQPKLALIPTSVAEVTSALAEARATGLAVVIQGGNTGLVGGAVGDDRPHLVLKTTQLRETLVVNPEKCEVIVSAGFTLGEVQQAAKEYGLFYPVDLAARDSATIGGTVATNAGGLRVVAYGATSQHLLGVELVTASGVVEDWLDGTSPNVQELVPGGEGTFGVITKLRLGLVQERKVSWTAFVPCNTLKTALSTAEPLRASLLAAEIMAGRQLKEVAEVSKLSPLPESPWWLLIEGEDEADLDSLPTHCLFATQPNDSAKWWRYRENHTEVIARRGSALKIDSSVPPSNLPEFVNRIFEIAAKHSIEANDVFCFGHLLVGNLHLAFIGGGSELESEVMQAIVDSGGSIRGEHGIGQAKRGFRSIQYSTADLEKLRLTRQSLDSEGILNPQIG